MLHQKFVLFQHIGLLMATLLNIPSHSVTGQTIFWPDFTKYIIFIVILTLHFIDKVAVKIALNWTGDSKDAHLRNFGKGNIMNFQGVNLFMLTGRKASRHI